MSIEFDKLSNEELEDLKKKAEANLTLMSNARSFKDRSRRLLTRFQGAIAELAKVQVLIEKGVESNSYDRNNTTRECRTLKLAGPTSELRDAFRKILDQDFYGNDTRYPFGLVPMAKFWEEWSAASAKMTIRLVNKYMKTYVEPYPTEPAEAVKIAEKSFKVGEVIEEAAQVIDETENDIPF